MNSLTENSSMPIETIAVFDVCDTLYSQNTTFGFIRYTMRNKKIFLILDKIATCHFSPIFLFIAILNKMTGKDLLRNLYLWCLAGKKRSDLDLAADAYVKEVLEHLALTWTHTALTEALRQSQTVCLCSASIDCVVNAIARHLGTLCFSSKLEYAGEVCTGRLEHDITGKKKEIIQNLPGFLTGITRVRVFTDNFTDVDLVKFSNEAHVILPGGRGRQKWSGCKVVFIDV